MKLMYWNFNYYSKKKKNFLIIIIFANHDPILKILSMNKTKQKIFNLIISYLINYTYYYGRVHFYLF